MPIDLDKVVGARLPETTFSWDHTNVILYHLGIGAGNPATDAGELEYCYEANLKVLPSFGSVPAFEAMVGFHSVDGIDVNLATLLHGEQETILTRPLSTTGNVVNRASVTDVFDKGKGALVMLEIISESPDGEELFRNRVSIFLRGEGGFGGESGPRPANPAPDREPDAVVESPTFEQQALLYRLSGDWNPLHADPAFAAMGGFERPILHGLCTYGIVCKAAVDTMLDGEVARVAGYKARFSGSVMPGETIVTSLWDEGDRVVMSAIAKERSAPVIANAAISTR
jgi:acyl dehydratase